MSPSDLARAFNVTPTTASRWIDDGCPLGSERHAADWLRQNPKRHKHLHEWDRRNPPESNLILPGKKTDLDLTPQAMLTRVQTAEAECYREYEDAPTPFDKGKWLQLHAVAVKNRLACENEVMSLAIQSGQLLTPQAAQDVILAALTPLARWLDELADAVNARCPLSLEQRQAITEACEEAKATIRASLPNETP